MTKIMAVLLSAFLLVIVFTPEAAGKGQDAKSVAIDATHVTIHKESTKGLQRVREVINKRALREIAEKHRAIQQRRAEARAQARAAARAEAQAQAQSQAQSNYANTSVPAVMACIREHESGGNYTIVNSYGYAGAYQLSPEYKDDWARRYGYPQYADLPVVEWPPAVQDAVATALYEDTNGHAWSDFAPYDCGWG